MFLGATKITLDAKGRMAIPTKYRDQLLSAARGELVVTVDRDGCLLVYPRPEWEEVERKLSRLPTLNKKARSLQRLMLGYATELVMDGHGRILLTSELREFAEIERQAWLVGQGNKFELWNEERWAARREEFHADKEGKESGPPQEFESLIL
jgi:MraZ protein